MSTIDEESEEQRPCEDCGTQGATLYEWGHITRWFCDACVKPAYERWKAEREETYP